ncbi:MAG: hypothetical protein II721_00415 [Bacilli bacterium]|nr:hypothetical protein [Bacilli bacterium]
MKKQTKTALLTLSITMVLLLSIPSSVFIMDAATGEVYSKSYYAEWGKMYSKLRKNGNKKIVLIGNSAVAFGVNSKLIQNELSIDGLDYEVVNFGLYGALGTKFMLDFSINHLNKDDIAIIMPEEYPQSMSLYENKTEQWKAFEGARDAYFEVPFQTKGTYINGYFEYVAGKGTLVGKEMVDGVYALSSFDDNCDMSYERKDNQMLPYFHAVGNEIVFDDSLLNPSFLSYLNQYAKKAKAKGATTYYLLAPMNERGIAKGESVSSFYQSLSEKLSFPILGNPEDSVMEANWFYNSDFHLNSAGMQEFSLRLLSAIKNEFAISSPSSTPHPEMPELPKTDDFIQGDDSDEAFFTYEEVEGGGYSVTSLLDEERESLVLPSTHLGKPVVGFSASLFQNNKVVKEITIQENVRMILDYSFSGCSSLRKVILTNPKPSSLLVGFHLLDGAESLRFYVPKEAHSSYVLDYLWGRYAEYLETI